MIEGIDGETHINIYSKGKTEIGRWLSNFSYSPIQTEHGWFNSIEGYWYWQTTLNDHLRECHGFAAKKLGKESEKVLEVSPEVFQDKIKKAIDLKLKLRPKDIADINLPLAHYYDYGGKKVEKPEYNWITEHIETRIKQLKEYYAGKMGNSRT